MEREQWRPAGSALARQNSCSRETGESVSPWRRRQEVRLRVGQLPSWARGGEKTGVGQVRERGRELHLSDLLYSHQILGANPSVLSRGGYPCVL